MIHLVPLGPEHAEQILHGQDQRLADEVFGVRWEAETLDAFLRRAGRWRADGPLREFAAMAPAEEVTEHPGAVDHVHSRRATAPAGRPAATGSGAHRLIGGGGIHLLGAGLDRGQAALTYWVLPAHRGLGLGARIAGALVQRARLEARIVELVLRIAPGNSASQAVARGIGARPLRTGHATVTERHPADAARLVERWTLPLR